MLIAIWFLSTHYRSLMLRWKWAELMQKLPEMGKFMPHNCLLLETYSHTHTQHAEVKKNLSIYFIKYISSLMSINLFDRCGDWFNSKLPVKLCMNTNLQLQMFIAQFLIKFIQWEGSDAKWPPIISISLYWKDVLYYDKSRGSWPISLD
jgi:hypothetical protein